jgi:HEAT repeat protein
VVFALVLAAPLVPRAEDVQARHYNLDPLAKDLETGLEYRRIMAVQILGKVRNPEAIGMLIHTMLYDRGEPVRRAAQRELAGVQDPRVYPAIQAALADRQRWIRLAGLEALGLVRDPAAADVILATAAASPKDTELVLLAFEALRTFVYHIEPAPGFETRLAPYLQHADDKVRRTVAAILGLLARPASLDPLLAAWPAADARLQVLLCDAYANIGWAKPVPLLIKALTSRDRDVTIHALYALAQIQAFSALPEVRRLLEQATDPRVRMAGLNALIEVPDPENVPAVLKQLDASDASVRHWAAYALGELDAQSAIPALRARLQDRDTMVRATAATALAALRDRGAESALLAMLAEPKGMTEVQEAAARALMTLESRAGGDFYFEQLKRQDLDRRVRMTYALALAATRDLRFVERLEGNLNASDFGQAFTAALALAGLGKGSGRSILLQALDHGDPFLRRYAILGLERDPDPEAIRALSETAGDDPDTLVRVLCAAALVGSGHPEFRVLLWNALDHKDPDLRAEAVIGLGRNADAEVRKQLKWYLRREPSVPVRETILRVLRKGS